MTSKTTTNENTLASALLDTYMKQSRRHCEKGGRHWLGVIMLRFLVSGNLLCPHKRSSGETRTMVHAYRGRKLSGLLSQITLLSLRH
jgi:hypothetical protein